MIERRKYDIYAFAAVDWKKADEVRAAIYLLAGAGAGLALPTSASTQFNAGLPWEVSDNPNNNYPGGWGGHYVYLSGYDANYLTCITWGKKQKIAWDFLEKYCDELFAIVDNRNAWLENSPIDVVKLSEYLKDITQ
jgi:hypothetical protein